MSMTCCAETVRRWVTALYPELPVGGAAHAGSCAVLDWAASGAMALTGYAGRAPVASPAGAIALLAEVSRVLAQVTGGIGTPVHADPALVLTARAGLRGLSRSGRVSAGGATRLLRAADGWCAVTLSRPEDAESVPAITGRADVTDPWQALGARRGAPRRASLPPGRSCFGVPAAALPRRARAQALRWRCTRICAHQRHEDQSFVWLPGKGAGFFALRSVRCRADDFQRTYRSRNARRMRRTAASSSGVTAPRRRSRR